MPVKNLCRLCSTGENLIWVFDKRFQDRESMRNVIMITTSVEIQPTDTVSQKICEKCCKITVKMYEFRKQAIANDKRLKELQSKHMEQLGVTPPKAELPTLEPPIMQNPSPTKTAIKIHPSVKDIFQQYPSIKLPSICLNADVAPCVTMPIDYVEDYFKSRNLNFHAMSTLALRSSMKIVARKRTAPPDSPYRCPINAEIIPDGYANGDNDNLVRPIKLKIISNVNLNVADDIIVCDKPPPKDPEMQETHRKRKLSDVMEVPEVEVKKPAVLESSELTKNESSNNLSYVATVSVPLHICNMCSAVCYHAKDLKKHQSKHLRCQFCKEKFKCLEKKEEHLEGQCLVKNMNSLPDIELERIEFDPDIRRKYPEAFVDFPPLQGVSEDLNSKDSTDECEVIEILDDSSDEEEPPKTNASLKRRENQIIHTKENLPSIQAIRPDISIKNSTLFKDLDPKANDVKLLRDLLVKIEPLKRYTDKAVETDLSLFSPININESSSTAEFKSLKTHLHSYKIPVIIKPGEFTASFSKRTSPQRERKLCLWNDLTPVDIKPASTPSALPNDSPEAPSATSISASEPPTTAVDILPELVKILTRPQLSPASEVVENSNDEVVCVGVSNPLEAISEVEPSPGHSANSNQNSVTNTTDIVSTVNSMSSLNYVQSDTTNSMSTAGHRLPPVLTVTNSTNGVAKKYTASSNTIPSSDVLVSATSEPSSDVELSFGKAIDKVSPPLPTFTVSDFCRSSPSAVITRTTRSNYTISQSTSTTICADSVKFAPRSHPSSCHVQSAAVSNTILNFNSKMSSVAALPPPYSRPPPPYPKQPPYHYAPPRAVYLNKRRKSQNGASTSDLRNVRIPRANSVPSVSTPSGYSQLNAPSNFRSLPNSEDYRNFFPAMADTIKAAFERDKSTRDKSALTYSAGLERLIDQVISSSVSNNSFTASTPSDVTTPTSNHTASPRRRDSLVHAEANAGVFVPSSTGLNNSSTTCKSANVTNTTRPGESHIQSVNTSMFNNLYRNVVSTSSTGANNTPTSNHTTSHRRDSPFHAEANTGVFVPSSTGLNNSSTTCKSANVTNPTRPDESHIQSVNTSMFNNLYRNVVSTSSTGANTTPTSNYTTSSHRRDSLVQAEANIGIFVPSSTGPSNNSFATCQPANATNKTRPDESHLQSSLFNNPCRNVVSTGAMSANTAPTSNYTTSSHRRDSLVHAEANTGVFVPSSTGYNNSFTTPKPANVTTKTGPDESHLQNLNTSMFNNPCRNVVSTASMSANTAPISNYTTSPHRRDSLVQTQTTTVIVPSSTVSTNSFATSKPANVINETSMFGNSCRNVVSTASVSANTMSLSNYSTSPRRANFFNQAESCSAAVAQNAASIPNDIVPPCAPTIATAPHPGSIRIKSMWELI